MKRILMPQNLSKKIPLKSLKKLQKKPQKSTKKPQKSLNKSFKTHSTKKYLLNVNDF